MRSALSFLLAASAASPALAALKEVWYNVTYVENTAPDGLTPRRAVGVNGTWPPPPLDVNEDDYVIVHAHNSLSVGTSLHHHGMFFNGSSWMDGAVGVSECGIPPGGDFDYHIAVNESGQVGTYWWHAHDNGHYTDGLRAPVLIHALNETHKYDEEFTVILSDWYHTEHPELIKQFISIANPGGAEPVPDSGLIYFAHDGSYLGPVAGSSPAGSSAAVGFNENATLPFQPGKTYRLRILNAGAFAAQWFWIDGHEMRIIEVDGTDVEEFPIDLIQIAVAQRYSILVTARNDTSANFAVHSNFDTDMFDTVPDTLQPNMTATITYNPTAPLTSNTIDAYTDLPDTSLVPSSPIAMPVADRTVELEVLFDTLDDGTNRAMFNMISYEAPLVPTILSELTLGPNATVATAYGRSNFVLDHLSVFDIIVKNGDAGKHPFHLHGHKFQVVNRATDYTSDDPSLNPPITEGQANPVRRDTIAIPSMGSAALRVVADNPGAWFFHCHIEWHLEAGLAVTFTEAPAQALERAQSVLAPPASLNSNCAALGRKTSGNAAGIASATDLKGLPEGPQPQNNGWHPKGIAAMFGCVLTATIGMATVIWYALGGGLSDEEVEDQWRKKRAAKEARGRFFGLGKALGKSS